MSLLERLAALTASRGRGVLFTVIEGDDVGANVLVLDSGETFGEGPADVLRAASELMREGRNRLLTLVDGSRVFAEVYGPPPRLLVYGAVDLAEALCVAAKLQGWTAIVADARGAFATRERIPSADELIVAWPEQAFARVKPDHRTAVVVLTHDDRFDVPALVAALAGPAFYVGALGSRRNQERRRELLREAGVAEVDYDRIMGPCGLDIGAETQEATALSILAEIHAVRTGREGGFLKHARQRIHVESD
ncbi:MAG: XdhC family protein [Actinobacteria bacterium]|nr:XdhC family protein [Actinomycetota bacterium]